MPSRRVFSLVQPFTGIECEALRVNQQGKIAQTNHPDVFGNKLANPYFTTDYAEQQIEMITPPLDDIESTYKRTLALMHIAQLECKRNDELLWPASTPCALPDEADI